MELVLASRPCKFGQENFQVEGGDIPSSFVADDAVFCLVIVLPRSEPSRVDKAKA